jgi:hypothetical protein
MYVLSKGPDHRARVFNRCFINGFLFQTTDIEKNLTTQNSGVVVKADDSTGNMDWYGVIRKIISLEFPSGKEVIMFKCDWYDVPASTKNKGRGYKKDQYGIIDIDTTCFRYVNDPYILGTQAEQVVYVKGMKKPEWCTVVRLKPRNLFVMPKGTEKENEGDVDVNSLDVSVEDMAVSCTHEELKNWRTLVEGESGDASVIDKALAEAVPERNDSDLLDEEDDDTYINDGHIAPADSLGEGSDDEFFCLNHYSLLSHCRIVFSLNNVRSMLSYHQLL